MQPLLRIRDIRGSFFRHDRWYCLFRIEGRDEDFLYYSHTTRPLRSLMFGTGFFTRLPDLMENDDLCIECGMGPAVAGGVALDNGDIVAWNCTVDEANQILAGLRVSSGEDETRIQSF